MKWSESGRNRATESRVALLRCKWNSIIQILQVYQVENLFPFMLAALQLRECLTNSFDFQDHITLY